MADESNIAVPTTFSAHEKTRIIDLVRSAARTEIMPRFRQLDAGEIDTKRDETDLVTAADTGAEDMITRGLQAAYPHALVIGEEAVAKHPELLDEIGNAELCFIIDPVDGTWNFAHGLPLFGTIIAACRFGHPVFGLIYDPVGDDLILSDNVSSARWYTAMGQHKRIHTAIEKPLERLAGYIHIRLMSAGARDLCWSKVGALAYVGSLRCSAHEYRLLATGGIDFILSGSLNAWDHAAGVLICQQAGGKSAMLDGSDYDATKRSGYLLSAASETVWDTVAIHFAGLKDNT